MKQIRISDAAHRRLKAEAGITGTTVTQTVDTILEELRERAQESLVSRISSARETKGKK